MLEFGFHRDSFVCDHINRQFRIAQNSWDASLPEHEASPCLMLISVMCAHCCESPWHGMVRVGWVRLCSGRKATMECEAGKRSSQERLQLLNYLLTYLLYLINYLPTYLINYLLT